MSWTMWHVCGYGFDVSSAGDAKLLAFIKNHKEALAEDPEFKWVDELPQSCDEGGNFYEDLCEHADNVGDIIAYVIQKETGLGVYGPGLTDESEDCVLFGPCYPWEVNEAEKKLSSKDDVFEALRPYAEELGVEETLGFLDLIYSG